MQDCAVVEPIDKQESEALSPLSEEVLHAARAHKIVLTPEAEARELKNAFFELHKALDRKNPPAWEYQNHGAYSILTLKR